MRGLCLVAALATLVAFAPACAPAGPSLRDPAATGADATSARRLDGTTVAWDDALSGPRDKLLVFMTLWCKPCKAEQPAVEAWARAHADSFDTLVVVSGSPLEHVQQMVRDRHVALDDVTVWVDSAGTVAARYGISATPTLLWTSPDGRVRGTWNHIDAVSVEPGAPSAGGPPAEPVTDSGHELGTSYDVVVWADAARRTDVESDLASGRALVHALDERLSEWRPDSEVSRVNRLAASGPVPLAPDLRQLLSGARQVSEVTAGAFDITWRPLGDLWRDAMVQGVSPRPEALAEVLAAVGYRHVHLDDRGVAFDHPATRIGVAGVAKGWIIDALWRHLRERGWEDLIVNIGGDIRTSGRQGDGAPQVFRIADPWHPGEVVASIEVEDTAIATSGNYARVREVAGEPIGHILDPRTGRPPAFDGSVTVLTRDAAMADALATGLFVMGPDAGLALARQTPGLEVIYVTRSALRSTLSAVDGRPLPL